MYASQKLVKKFDKLQKIYGDKNLNAICGAGKTNKPKLCLTFMNPTGKNVASDKSWKGLRAPWIGTKNVWRMFNQLGLLNDDYAEKIKSKKAQDWNEKFSDEIYQEVAKQSLYITNLSKATQIDARPLSNSVFRNYLNLFLEEISIVNPRIIVTFGNQVSSVLLDKNIKVSEYRKKFEPLKIKGKEFKVFPVYYPVGQGMRNIDKAKEDINWILDNF
jgi:DNA polymerase